MGRVRIVKTIKFSYVIDDAGFSGAEIATNEVNLPILSAIDAYLEPDETTDVFEVLSQSVVVEQETCLTDDELRAEGEVVLLDCGHCEYHSRRCVVEGCSNYIGLITHKEWT